MSIAYGQAMLALHLLPAAELLVADFGFVLGEENGVQVVVLGVMFAQVVRPLELQPCKRHCNEFKLKCVHLHTHKPTNTDKLPKKREEKEKTTQKTNKQAKKHTTNAQTDTPCTHTLDLHDVVMQKFEGVGKVFRQE